MIGVPETDYREWVEQIYAIVREKLGGEAGQSGGTRRYGKAIFGHSMEHKSPHGQGEMGMVKFVITSSDNLPRRSRDVSFEWRAHPDVRVVAAELLRLYGEISQGPTGNS